MKKLLLSLTAALVCLIPSAWAQISVTAGGAGPLTFDTTPTVADGWSTISVAGAAGDITVDTVLDAAVIANTSATAITTPLGTSATLPPSQNAIARHNTAGLYLQTRPTGVNYLILMATLRNDSGGPISGLTVQFDWDQKNNNPVNEQIPGHRAYWSLTGTPGSWTLIPEFSVFTTTSTAAHLSAALNLGSWAAGTTMFVIWVDDNGAGSTTDPMEGSYTLDNVAVTDVIGAADTVLSLDTQPVPAIVNESQTANFSVTVSGSGAKYHWFKEGNPTAIAGATGRTLTITNCQAADVGNYYVTITNSLSSLQSTHVHLTVNADLTSPTVVRAILSNDLVTVLISFSEPVEGGVGSGAEDTLNYTLYIDTPGDGPAIADATFEPNSNQTNVVLTLFGAATPGVNYLLQLDNNNVTDRAANHNLLTGGPTPVSSFAPIMTFAGQAWKFHQPAVAAPADWFTTGFDDSSWSNGLSCFDNTTTTPGRTTLPGSMEAVNYFLPMTNAEVYVDATTFTVTNKIPTYYFRTHFSFPGDPSLRPAGTFLHVRGTVDDAVVIYLNGQFAFRGPANLAPAANDPFDSYGNGTGIGNGAIEGPWLLPATNLHSGDNVIAVLLKQGNGTSSDITMGLELQGIIPVVVQPLSLTITRDGSGGLVD